MLKEWKNHWNCLGAVIGVVVIFFSSHLSAAPLSDSLPYDTLAFVEIDPTAITVATERKGRGEFFDLAVTGMSSLGVMPREAAAVTNMLRMAGQLGQHRNALAWLDADFIVDYDTGKLSARSAQLAWIVDVDGQPDQFLTLLSGVLSDYSTPQTARQSLQSTGTTNYVEFYDTRWPSWFRLYWMAQGNNLVMTLGAGSMEHYITHAAHHRPWETTFAQVDQTLATHGAAGALVLRGWCSIKEMRNRWPDVMTMTIGSRLLKAFDLRYADQAVVTGTLHDRAFSVNYATLENHAMTLTPWTADLPADAPLLKLVPPDATFYMVFNMDWHALYVRVDNVLDIAQEKQKDEGIKEVVKEYANTYGVDVQGDIVRGLSPLVLIHDSPRHPLRLPGMVTVIAAAKPEAAQRVRFAVDKLVAQSARVLDHRAKKDGTDSWVDDGDEHDLEPGANPTPGRWAHPQIRRDKDDVTYLQYGLAGPAWLWVDRRFIFSWSPNATRQVADLVRQIPVDSDWFNAVPVKAKN